VTERLAQRTPRLLDGLLADVQAFRAVPVGTAMPDDVCLLAVDYFERGAGGGSRAAVPA
jgi:hypothetical protein